MKAAVRQATHPHIGSHAQTVVVPGDAAAQAVCVAQGPGGVGRRGRVARRAAGGESAVYVQILHSVSHGDDVVSRMTL